MSADRVDAAVDQIAARFQAETQLAADIAFWQEFGQADSDASVRLLAYYWPSRQACPECDDGVIRRVGSDSGLDVYACRCGWSS